MVSKRNSNIEILRIISILFIVVSHYSVHNGIDNNSLSLGINRFILEISTLGNIGVILFVLITGYFMIDNKKGVRIGKLLALYFQVLFYSLLLYLIFVMFGYETFSIKLLIKYMFPITFQQYWFVTVYIILCLLSPYINKFLNGLSRKDNLKFLIIMFLIFSILPTFTKMNFYGNEIVQFVLFYSIGAYLKKYPNNIFSNNIKFNYFVLILSIIILLSSVLVIDILCIKFNFNMINSIYFFNRNSSIAIIFSLSLFNLFACRTKFYSNKINMLSSLVFGIYLLSDHNIVRKFLWVDLLKNADYVFSNYFLLHFLLSVIFVFIVCGVVEFIRKNTIEKLLIYILMRVKKNRENILMYKKINYLLKYLNDKFDIIYLD